jgi:hypothetical protein
MASIISAGTTSGTALNMAGDTSGVLQLATNGSTTAVTINTSQNVGIGTTSPAVKLDVSASGNSFVRAITTSNSQRSGCVATALNSTGGTLTGQFIAYGDVGTGEVGINVSTNHPLTLGTNNTERMRIDSSGNVGIGITPVNTLDVAGTIRAVNNNYIKLGFTGVEATLQYVPNGNLEINPRGGFNTTFGGVGIVLTGSTAQKASGTTWSNPSDQRLKDNIRDYTKGTTELMQVRVREWEYNGKGGTTEGLKGLGVIADEVMTVLPNTVETYDAKLNADDEETTAIKKFDATEITWLLVKTVQEQQTIINDLKARITALEGAA